MKKRPYAFIGEDEIDHDGEIFDYIKELHAYLWRVIWAVTPGASGTISDRIDRAVETLEARESKVKALVDAARAVVDGANREIAIAPADCTCGACTRRNRLADALAAFEVPE